MQLCRLALAALICLLPACHAAESKGCVPEVLRRFSAAGYPKKLDVGIYWVGPSDQVLKAEPGIPNRFYNPQSPTIIYFHGWAGKPNDHGGWVETCGRITMQCPEGFCPPDKVGTYTADEWIRSGWNVGLFFWDQFSDEACPRDVERKVWYEFTDRTYAGLRWKSFDPETGEKQYHENDYAPTQSVTTICADVFKSVMSDYRGPTVRFVGESLGTQLAASCAGKLHAENHVSAPSRLALLEPIFSHTMQAVVCLSPQLSDPGIYALKTVLEIAKHLYETKQVVTEVYKTSVLSESYIMGLPGHDLTRLGTMVYYHPHWCGGLGPIQMESFGQYGHLECRHSAVVRDYFLAWNKPPPRLSPPPSQRDMELAADGSALRTCPVPSASCTDFQIWEWVERQNALGGRQYWNQVEGTGTWTLDDDAFKLYPRIGHKVTIVDEGTNPHYAGDLRPSLAPRGIGERWADLRATSLSSDGMKKSNMRNMCFFIGGACIAVGFFVFRSARKRRKAEPISAQSLYEQGEDEAAE